MADGGYKAYQRIVKGKKTNGLAWFRLGMAHHNIGNYTEAVKPYQEALNLWFQTTTVTFRLARVYAILKQSDQAFAELEKATKQGFATTKDGFALEPDLDNIRSLPRFGDIVKLAEASICTTCNGQAEYRQFDFWVDEWDVRPFATPNAIPTCPQHDRTRKRKLYDCWELLHKRLLYGQEFQYLRYLGKKWRRFWNNNFGQVIQYEGEYDEKEKALKCRSVSRNSQGQKVLGKMTFYNLSPDKVRQLWESSTDDSKTWTGTFDGLYTLWKWRRYDG